MDNQRKFISGIVPPNERSEPAWWFAFQGSKLLIYEGSSSITIPRLQEFEELGLKILRRNYLGRLDSTYCYAVELNEGTSPPPGMAFLGLRKVYGRLDEAVFCIFLVWLRQLSYLLSETTNCSWPDPAIFPLTCTAFLPGLWNRGSH
jgi:NADH pyrophosphatase NudC (nudix superfamily)